MLKNTGFIAESPRPTDWVCGAVSGITFQECNHMSDWTVFLPSEERQNSVYFDSMACVTFSALNCIEAQIRAHIAYQRLPGATIKALKDLGYFNDRLEFNLSDRFTAKMSGTTRQGNTFVNVWDSIRKHGVLPEGDWNYPREQRTPVFDWDDYYQEIPQALKDKAKRFLDLFDIKYEWLTPTLDDYRKHLAQSPIQIAAPTCPGWNTDSPVNRCGMMANHATMLYRVSDNIHDFDTYNPFRKELAKDYPIFHALKGVVIPKP
jgi:hypothetical protein